MITLRYLIILVPCAWMALMCGSRVQAQSDDPNLARAVMLFEESEAAYNEGRFEAAVALLRRAYSLHEDPTLLFNLARALEGLGELDDAIDTYEQYVHDAPNVPDRGAIEARVRTLRTQRDRMSSEGGEDDSGPSEDESDAPEPSVPGRPLDPVPWVVAGGGVVLVGVGAVFGVLSQDKSSAAQVEPVQVTASDLHSEASTFATLANVLLIAGGVVAVGGAAWGVFTLVGGDGNDDDDGAVSAEAAIVPGGVVLRGQF